MSERADERAGLNSSWRALPERVSFARAALFSESEVREIISTLEQLRRIGRRAGPGGGPRSALQRLRGGLDSRGPEPDGVTDGGSEGGQARLSVPIDLVLDLAFELGLVGRRLHEGGRHLAGFAAEGVEARLVDALIGEVSQACPARRT